MQITDVDKFEKNLQTTEINSFFHSFFRNFSSLLIICCLLSISGCEQLFTPSFTTLCSQHHTFCQQLNQDYWCQDDKERVLRAYAEQQNSSENQARSAFVFFQALQHYDSCLVEAVNASDQSQINKKQKVIDSVRQIHQQLHKEYADAKQLDWQYLAWRNNPNQLNTRAILNHTKQSLSSVEHWLMLADVQRFNAQDQHALNTLHFALASTRVDEQGQAQLASQISQLYYSHDKIMLAYVWAKVADLLDYSPRQFKKLNAEIQADGVRISTLNNQAEKIVSDLNHHQYQYSL